jgi:hypothetical protein
MDPSLPEFQLLLAAARFPLSPAEADQLKTLARVVKDWKRFRRLVKRHKVAPLVYLNLSQYAAAYAPEKLLRKLKAKYERNQYWSGVLLAEFERLKETCAAHNVPIWLLKGPSLSQELFGQNGLRDTGDLDILVPSGQIELAQHLVESLGYHPELPVRPLQPRQWRAFKILNHHSAYLHPEKQIEIELHWSFANAYLMPTSALEAIQSRARTITEGDFNIPVLGLEDSLMGLLIHGAKHQWATLKLVVDIDAFVRRSLPVDWDSLIRTMADLKLQRILAQGFGLAARVLGTPLPPAVQQVLDSEPETQRLVEGAWLALLAKKDYLKVPGPFTEFGQALYISQLRPGWRYRFSYLSTFLLHSLNDWTDYPLPDALFPLYYLMRPFTWARRYFWPRVSNAP